VTLIKRENAARSTHVVFIRSADPDVIDDVADLIEDYDGRLRQLIDMGHEMAQEIEASDATLRTVIGTCSDLVHQIKDAEAAMDALDEELRDVSDKYSMQALRSATLEEQAKSALAGLAPTQRRKDHLEKTLQQIQQILTRALIDQPTGISRVTARQVAQLAGAAVRGGSQNADDAEAGSC
jgi:chromosome segregation ATPase